MFKFDLQNWIKNYIRKLTFKSDDQKKCSKVSFESVDRKGRPKVTSRGYIKNEVVKGYIKVYFVMTK